MENENKDEFNTREEQLTKELNETKMELQEANRKIDELQQQLCSTKTELEEAKREIGILRSTMRLESFIVVFGNYDHGYYSKIDAFKINLNRPDEVSSQQQLPVEVKSNMAAAVYCRSVFVTGIGEESDEIWKFDARCFEWKKCASLMKSRSAHSVAFVDHILYVCSGLGSGRYICAYVDVEAYDAKNDRCSVVGNLNETVYEAGNCVPYKVSLYIFGGRNAYQEIVNTVQVYDTKLNSCTTLKPPMPKNQSFWRAALLTNYVILLGDESCFLYNFDTNAWEVRDQFKTGVRSFGMTVHNENLFVIGGRDSKWFCRDDVRCVPISNIVNNEPIEWKHHAKLPKPSAVHVFGKLEFLVQPI